MAFFKEVFAKDIKGALFPDNAFISVLKDRTSEVLEGKTISFTQAGPVPAIETGETITYPLPVVERQDETVTFGLRAFASPVIRVTNLIEQQLNVNYRQSVLSETTDVMMDKVAEYAFYQMIVANSSVGNTKQDGTVGTGQVRPEIIETTGTLATSSLHESGQERKGIAFGDFRKAGLKMDRMNVPKAGRYAIITADQAYTLFGDDALKYRDPYGFNFNTGALPQVHGFSVIIRSRVAVQTTAGVAKDMSLKTATIAATDDGVSIFMQKDAAYKAIGQTNPFFQLKDPLWQSDTFSYNQYVGVGRERKDSKGIILLKEAKGA